MKVIEKVIEEVKIVRKDNKKRLPIVGVASGCCCCCCSCCCWS